MTSLRNTGCQSSLKIIKLKLVDSTQQIITQFFEFLPSQIVSSQRLQRIFPPNKYSSPNKFTGLFKRPVTSGC